MTWQPSASVKNLRRRAEILQQVRHFFAARNIMEVETPLLCHTSVTDPYIESIPVIFNHPGNYYYYLQTSPEYAMKRLLAAGSGAIYQISKAFRQGEIGRFHNPEFTMLEWYHPDFDAQDLMDEIDALLQCILQTPRALRRTYAEIFQTYCQLDPHHAKVSELRKCAEKNNIVLGDLDSISSESSHFWFNLLMTHVIEPQLGKDQPCFIYDFPIEQAALARIKPGNPPVASRFEVYVQGIELANGFHELQDSSEQRKRFAANLEERQKLGLPPMLIDENFLAALAHGLPNCTGVALGFDRLVMLATKQKQISDVLSFDITRV